MSDEVENLLGGVKPRGAGTELRGRVLAAVGREWRAEAAARWQRRCALGVAASLALAVGLNYGVASATHRRVAQVIGPAPVVRAAAEIAADVAAVSDARTGQWVYDRLAAAHAPGDLASQYAAKLQCLLDELQREFEESRHAQASQEDRPLERDRPRGSGPGGSAGQRLPGVDHRRTA